MTETDHLKELIIEKFDGLQTEVVGVKDIALEGLAQGKRTNGRVSELEKWRDQTAGGIKVLGIIAVPLVLFFIYKLFS